MKEETEEINFDGMLCLDDTAPHWQMKEQSLRRGLGICGSKAEILQRIKADDIKNERYTLQPAPKLIKKQAMQKYKSKTGSSRLR